jgi:hypothetical protein
MKENREKRRDDGGMMKWLEENQGELIGIKLYLSTQNTISFLPNLQVFSGDFFIGLKML